MGLAGPWIIDGIVLSVKGDAVVHFRRALASDQDAAVDVMEDVARGAPEEDPRDGPSSGVADNDEVAVASGSILNEPFPHVFDLDAVPCCVRTTLRKSCSGGVGTTTRYGASPGSLFHGRRENILSEYFQLDRCRDCGEMMVSGPRELANAIQQLIRYLSFVHRDDCFADVSSGDVLRGLAIGGRWNTDH